MDTISKGRIPDAQIDQLDQLKDNLPAEIREVLQALASSLREGDDVIAFEVDDTITPTDAAQRLRMSRTHLYKLLDKGEIPFHRVGRDRRIRIRDLASFVQRRDKDRRELAERFAARQQIENDAARELAELL